MTKKDYILFAEAIRLYVPIKERKIFLDVIMPIFERDNKRFDSAKFEVACGSKTIEEVFFEDREKEKGK